MKEFLDILKLKGRQLVTIIDPHMKVDDSFEIYSILKDSRLFVMEGETEENLKDFQGPCWPGISTWVDFINYEKVVAHYKNFYKREDYFLNSDNFHTWNDMNEPTVFNVIDKVIPKNCWHFDGERLVRSYEVHNIYGYMQQKISYESLKHRYANKIRPFILSRSFYAGSQQYGFIWTGDNRCTWDFMESSIETIIGTSLCGFSAVGADVGGFYGTPSEELMRCWFQVK